MVYMRAEHLPPARVITAWAPPTDMQHTDRPIIRTMVAPVVHHEPGTWRLLYFDAPTRGEQIRVLFALMDTPFVDVRLTPFPEGLDPYKKAAMGSASPLCGTDLCPAVTAPDGTHCVETVDTMRFVGITLAHWPERGSLDDGKAMKFCLLAQELLNQVFYPLLRPMISHRIVSTEVFGLLNLLRPLLLPAFNGGKRWSEYVPPAREKLEVGLAAVEAGLLESGGPYLLGERLSYGDASIYTTLEECLAYECFDRSALMQAHPRVHAFMQAVGKRASPWMRRRVREHQMGIRSTVEVRGAEWWEEGGCGSGKGGQRVALWRIDDDSARCRAPAIACPRGAHICTSRCGMG